MYTSINSRVMLVCAMALLVMFAMPRQTHASALTLATLTATSSNTASSTLIKTGQTLNFVLTLTGGTPWEAPKINIFNMGSTTMVGSVGNWSYSTTSASTWTEGAISFLISYGGTTVGDATSTKSQTNLTSANVSYDKTAPTISPISISTNNTGSSALGKTGDTVTLSFTSSEAIQKPTVTIGAETATVASSSALDISWTATAALSSSDTDGTLTFQITTPTDWASNATTSATWITTGSSVVANQTAPVITVLGTNPDSTQQRSGTYSDAGATATDAHDGTTAVITSGTVNPAVNGTQTLTYSSTDTAGNTSTATRTVVVGGSGSGGGGGGGIVGLIGGGGGGGGGGYTPPAQPASNTANSSSNASVIAALQQQLQTLLAQIAALGGHPNANAYMNASSNASFKRDLKVGMLGSDVKALQEYLNSHGYTIAVSGPGSSGNETTKFGNATKAALKELQKDAGIPPTGTLGPKTRAYIAANP